MNKIKIIYMTAWRKAMDFEGLLLALILLNLAFIILGQLMVMQGVPEILEFKKEILKNLPATSYLQPILGSFAPYLLLKILYTFFFNLIFGAFLSTTIPGLVFFLPFFIIIGRALYIGIIFYGISTSVFFKIFFIGTFILEFGGYIFSTLAGINLGLSLAFPKKWKKKEKSVDAFKEAIEDMKWFYILAATFLFFGAIWEMTWMHYFGEEYLKKIVNPIYMDNT